MFARHHTVAGRPGFTLIEVTLSIVIGIILMAGATLLYNQAKVGAGNARARSKVQGLRAVVEELVANGGGNMPSALGLYNAWNQRRPDDVGQNPWGGPAGSPAGGASLNRQGYVGQDPGSSPSQGTTYAHTGPENVPDRFGCVEYWPITATQSFYDIALGYPATCSNYGLWAYDSSGNRFYYVQGGR